MLVLPVIPYPSFDPILISIGPLAIRWYALAYIVGIIAGWFYARRIIPNESILGRAGAAHRARFRRLRCLDHARHHSRRPHRLCAVLQSAVFRRAPSRDFSNSGTAACRFTAASSDALSPSSCSRGDSTYPTLSLGDVSCAAAPIGLFLGRIANFINGELWGRPTDVPWAMVFPHGGPLPRHPSQLYEASLEGVVLFLLLGALVRAGALKRPGTVIGAFFIGYGIARTTANSFASPTYSLDFCGLGLAHHGHAALHPAGAHRSRAACRRPSSQAGHAARRPS